MSLNYVVSLNFYSIADVLYPPDSTPNFFKIIWESSYVSYKIFQT